jgi:hypothetical protein
MKNLITNNKIFRSLTLAGVLLMSAFSAQASLILSFSETDVEVQVNDTFTLDLYVTVTAPVDSILAWGLDLDLSSSSLLNLNSFTLGTDFINIDGLDDGIGGASPTAPLFGSNILLGSFEFTALAVGDTIASTSNNDPLFEGFVTTRIYTPTEFNSASANISVADSSAVAVPEPATLGFFIIGALALFGLRRKV